MNHLPRIASDVRNAHPDACSAEFRIPFLQLIGELDSVLTGEANVIAIGFDLAEVEPVLVQTDQHREVFN